MFVYAPNLKGHMEDISFICNISKLWNQFPRVFASDRLRPSKRIQNSFLLIVGDIEEGFVLLVSKQFSFLV